MDVNQPEPMTNLRASRRDRLIDVAEGVFVANGFRGTTMEGLAEAAEVSKATLYSYFSDKAALFDAVAARLAERIVAAVEAALASRGTPRERVAKALAAKHAMLHGLLGRSPHAAELVAAKRTMLADRTRETDARIVSRLAGALAGTDPNPRATASFLLAASQGLADAAADPAEIEAGVERLCTLIE